MDIAEVVVVPSLELNGVAQVLSGVFPWAIAPDLAEQLWQMSEELTGVEFTD
ncbi:hypothetical protein [Paenibacillus yonginensis]|uniref:hypothetical protein n=1 Tax=Paenibacillus yonginensis TaxID=1462996 RepID=UPI001471443E|nr:hypothetical protein [Paenibacillus yonginensis]